MTKGRANFKGYYTPAQAMKILGVTRPVLDTYIRNGRIAKSTPPGRKQSVLNKEHIDSLATELQAFVALSSTEKEKALFVKCTPEDMDEVAKLIHALFDHFPTVKNWKEYLQRNPDIGYLLKTPDQIIGCAFLFPLTPERIAELFSHDETKTPSIRPEEIQPYEPGIPVHIYIRSVGIVPNIPTVNKRAYGARLVSGIITAFIELGRCGIEIKTIQARSHTNDGIRILRHIGFTEVVSTTTSHNFLIDVESSGLPAILEYKKALAEWKQEREEHLGLLEEE